MSGDDLPAGPELVGKVGKDLQVGAVCLGCPLHLARREESVLAPAEHQHRQLGDGRRPGKRESHHVEVGEVRLVLQPPVDRPDLRLAHRSGEKHLLGKLGRLENRPQAHRQVGPQESDRVAEQDAEGGKERTGGWHRGEEDRGGRSVILQVLLHDQPAHRMPDHDGRLGQRRSGLGDVGDVLGEPGPAEPLAARRIAVTAQVDRPYRPPAIGEVAEEVFLPAPGPVPGAVHEKKRRHEPLESPPR